MSYRFKNVLLIAGVFGPLALLAACDDKAPGSSLTPGQTDFVSEVPGSANGGFGNRSGAPTAGAAGRPEAAADNVAPPQTPAPAPMGRTGEVEEGDIYRIANNQLFYLNTYRGFLIYDVSDPKNPARLSRLPVFGYPVEMFVDGTTVYVLLRDALYLTQASGKLEFERHNVSQLVAIDVSDLRRPQVLKTIDIIGELREGVARKIENTIYVVSYISQQYYWGWRQSGQDPARKEQAWVYSFDVSQPRDPRLVQELKIFEGGSIQETDPTGKFSYNRYFSGVSISATANTVMVAENWQTSAYQSGPEIDAPPPSGSSSGTAGSTGGGSAPSSGGVAQPSCGSYQSSQQAVVSIIDISDPRGAIRRHTRFETAGQLTDQFKQTYVYDPATQQATYYGVFARQGWSSADCTGSQVIQNTLESWDVTDGNKPAKLHALDFGKKDETVRASAFDVDRKIVYAITARQIDPLYAISFADRQNLKVLSAIDGLSGDMTVFRLIAGKQFLMGIGRDNSETCTGFQDTDGWRAANMAVSIIDVRDLSRVRLVQRACVAIKNADWVGSDISWNMDQAHKMLGMYSDEEVNVITVPVYYTRRDDQADGWWWYRHETAVGMMTWDLSRYDDTKSEREQTVLRNFGTFVHPEGQVRRSILFKHQGATPQRMMINLSDTHISVANIQDVAQPRLESVVELAPYYGEIYQFGEHLVEHVQSSRSYGFWDTQGRSEFRVKRAGGDLDDVAPVATFSVGQVSRVIKHGSNLVVFRAVFPQPSLRGEYTPPQYEAVVYDLSDPTHPVQASRLTVPDSMVPYYHFWCGVDAYFGGFWFDQESNWAATSAGPVFLGYDYDQVRDTPILRLRLLDLRDLRNPRLREQTLPTSENTSLGGLTSDPVDPSGFYLGRGQLVEEVKDGQTLFTRVRHFAERWTFTGDRLQSQHAINLPGRLVRTFAGADGARLFLSQDYTYKEAVEPQSQQVYWQQEMRLSLLRQISEGDRPLAQLLDSHTFTDRNLNALVLEGDKLFASGQKQSGYYYGGGVGTAPARPGIAVSDGPVSSGSTSDSSDHLMVFDLSRGSLDLVYDQPTRTYGVQLMGTHRGTLFVNLPGDGILLVDVTVPASPEGVRFVRTLGYASHVTFAGSHAYVAAGHFGVYHLDLESPGNLAVH